MAEQRNPFEKQPLPLIHRIDPWPWRVGLPHVIYLFCTLGPVDETIFLFDFFAVGCLARILRKWGDTTVFELSERLDQCRSGYEGEFCKK
jgi:hypothetical protein